MKFVLRSLELDRHQFDDLSGRIPHSRCTEVLTHAAVNHGFWMNVAGRYAAFTGQPSLVIEDICVMALANASRVFMIHVALIDLHTCQCIPAEVQD